MKEHGRERDAAWAVCAGEGREGGRRVGGECALARRETAAGRLTSHDEDLLHVAVLLEDLAQIVLSAARRAAYTRSREEDERAPSRSVKRTWAAAQGERAHARTRNGAGGMPLRAGRTSDKKLVLSVGLGASGGGGAHGLQLPVLRLVRERFLPPARRSAGGHHVQGWLAVGAPRRI